MSRKRTPMGRLVWLRSIGERKARGELGRAQVTEAEARRRLDEIREAREMPVRVDEVLTPLELEAMRLQGMRFEEIEQAAASAHELAQQRLADRIGTWRSAVTARDSAQKLDDRRRLAHAAAATKAAEQTLDDLQVARRRRKQR